ncbi:MAG TPA: N-acetyltransferase [Candidatus Ventrimonas merdavium]|nr:N-acetyltransferase [Candidatus Ventrimonas merdavium]
MIIRQEQPADYGEIYHLVQEAFASAEHADGNEQDLVEALRKGQAYIPQLALAAEIDGELAGHILFTKGHVGEQEVLILAPLSVKPAFQKQGVGTALIEEGHRIARGLGYSYSLVLGSETYYPRFGYSPAEALGVEVPEGIPSENFMIIRLREDGGPVQGAVRYPAEFGL